MAATLIVFGTILWAAAASAEPIDNSFQLALGTDLFSYRAATVEGDATGAETDVSTTAWGVRGNVTLELGYGISDALVIGALLSLGGRSVDVEPPLGAELEST